MTEGVYRPPQTTKSPLCSCTAGIFCDTMLFSVAEQHRTEGAEDDTPVYQKAAFLDVLHIQCHPFVKAQLVAVRRNLPVAGKAGRGSSFILNPGCPSRCPAALSSKTAHFIVISCIPVDCKQDAEVSTDIPENVKKYRGGAALYPNRLFVLCIYTERTNPTQIYSISTELPPAE